MLYLIFWAVAVIYFNFLASTFASKRSKKIHDTPLPDILHDILPKMNMHTPDYLLLICFMFILLRGLYISPSAIARLLLSLSFRPIFICMTTFPTCNSVQSDVNQSIYSKLFLSQHDLMFSGHTCIFMFLGGVIQGTLGLFVQFLLPISLIAARQHYTIDVVVAMLLYKHLCGLEL